MVKFLHSIGQYVTLMFRVFAIPQKGSVFWKQLMSELQHLGVDSIGIVSIISVFMGAVVAIQTALTLTAR